MTTQFRLKNPNSSPLKNWISLGKHLEIQHKSIPYYGDLYHYAGNNPIKYTDPDGKVDKITIDWINNTVPPQYQDAALEFLTETKEVNGGTLSVKEIAAILFNETRSLSGDKIKQARNEIAHAIINGDKKWGEKRNKYARTAPTDASPPLEESCIYRDCMDVAKKSVVEDEEGIDPTDGAYFFNLRKTDSTIDFQGKKNHTSTGPLDNSYTDYKYVNTYGD